MKIRKKSDAEIINFENCHGGAGTVLCENMLKPEESSYGFQWFHYDRIPAGVYIGEHLHTASEEIYFLLSGGGTLFFNGETIPMRAGDMSMARDGDTHGFINDGDEDAIMIVVEVRPQSR